jgi:hypothetical protein
MCSAGFDRGKSAMSPGPACWRSSSAEQGRWAMGRAVRRHFASNMVEKPVTSSVRRT